MTKIEALELELAARKLVEGTELDWTAAIRCEGIKQTHFQFDMQIGCYELALGIIEGKPVWGGEEAYWSGHGITVNNKHNLKEEGWSWNPPTPKTVTVELTVEDAEILVTQFKNSQVSNVWDRTSAACRKALENPK